jgi:ABC-2 type transport system permease protein
MLLAVPALLLVLYGYALSFDVRHVRTAVLDEDRTPESRRFLDSLFRNPYFDRVGHLSGRPEADEWLSHGRAKLVLIIPRGYATRLARGERALAQALIDGTDAMTGNVVVGYLDALGDRATLNLIAERTGNRGGEGIGPAVTLEPRIWFNPDLISARFLVPGLIALLLMLSAVVATSVSIVRERERGTMEQIHVSAVSPEELILGKTLPYILIGLVTMSIVLFLGYVLFDVAIHGSYALLTLTSMCFLFAALGMGLLISSVMRTQQEAFQVAVLSSLLPSIILSGFIFPIASMPAVIQIITMLLPPRYFVSTLRAVILKGASFSMVWPDLLAMVLLGLAFNLLAARAMRKSQDRN